MAALEKAREEDGDDGLGEDVRVDRWLQQGLVTGYQDVRLTVQVFGDTTFRHDNPEPPGRSNSSFALGAMDLFATAQMGDHFQVLSETVFSVSNESASASQERLWGQWTFNDSLYAKLGLEHGLVSRWNRIFHHGPWLEPTIDRPLLARFEGDAQGILPLHNAGLEVGGHAELTAGRLEYAGIVSNGRGENPKDKQRVSDSNRAKGYELATAFVPACLEGLRFGGTFRYDQIPVDPTSPNPVRMRGIDEVIGSGFVELRHGALETRAEFAHVANRLDAGGANFDHQAGFAQVAWRKGMWLPYARFDVRRMERGDPFFAPLDRDLDRWQQTLGVRIDIHSHAAVKVEFGFGVAQRRAAAGNVDEGHFVTTAVQLSWAI